MAKAVLLDVLEKTIGQYVVNLDVNSLNVSIWKGHVELHSLQLDVEAVNTELASFKPPLPFRVKSGNFKSFQVHVPWRNLMNRPVSLKADGLSVQLEPYEPPDGDDDDDIRANKDITSDEVLKARQKSIHRANQQRVRVNALRELAQQDLEEAKDSASGTKSFGGKLIRRILENLEITFTDLHISLETSSACAGVVMESLNLHTTDDKGREAFVDRSNGDMPFLFKEMKIQGLGVYVDEKLPTGQRTAPPRFKSKIGNSLDQKAVVHEDHAYIIAPIALKAQLREADPNICLEYPRYRLSCELDAVHIILLRKQLHLAHGLISKTKDAMPRKELKPLFPEYRPLVKLGHGNPDAAKAWWRYAFRCVGRLNGRRSWVEFYNGFAKRKEYILLYQRQTYATDPHSSKKKSKEPPAPDDIIHTWVKPLAKAEKQRLESLEQDRSISVQGLMKWRDVAEAKMKKEKEKALKSVLSDLSSPFGSNNKAPSFTLTHSEMLELESQRWNIELDSDLQAIESKLYDITFVLQAFCVHLAESEDVEIASPIGTVRLGVMEAGFQATVGGAYEFIFGVETFSVEDLVSEDSLFRNVIRSTNYDDQSAKAMQLSASHSQTGEKIVKGHLNKVEVIASPLFLSAMKVFASSFASNENPSTSQPVREMQNTSTDNDAFRSLSNSLVDVWKQRAKSKMTWSIDIKLRAPIVIIPDSCSDLGGNSLVLDFGSLQFTHGLPHAGQSRYVRNWFQGNKQGSSVLRQQPTLDIFSLEFVSFSIAIAPSSALVHGKVADSPENTLLFGPISMFVMAGVEVSPSGSRICIEIVLPSLTGNVDFGCFHRVSKIAERWARFFDDPIWERRDSSRPIESENQHQPMLHSLLRNRDLLPAASPLTIQHIHCMVNVRRIFLRVRNDKGQGIEACLTHIESSLDIALGEDIEFNLSMGLFWVFHNLEIHVPCHQKLLLHSVLPFDFDLQIDRGIDNLLGSLESNGYFSPDASLPSNLALISIILSTSSRSPFDQPFLQIEKIEADLKVDAVVSSIHINCNPQVINAVNDFSQEFTTETKRMLTTIRPESDTAKGIVGQQTPFNMKRSDISIVCRCRMESLSAELRSPKDDLPLFTLAAASVDVMLIQDDENRLLKASLDDWKVTSSSLASSQAIYRTLVGISPEADGSIIKMEFAEGKKSLLGLTQEDIKERAFELGFEACAFVKVSPISLVVIQSQLQAFSTYLAETSKLLLPQNTASAAIAVATDVVKKTPISNSLFVCRADGMRVVIPLSAHSAEHFVMHLKNLQAELTRFPMSSSAKVSFNEFNLLDAKGSLMTNRPLTGNLGMDLPNKDNEGFAFRFQLPSVDFVLHEEQYRDLALTMHGNFLQRRTFLRDKDQREDGLIVSSSHLSRSHPEEGIVPPAQTPTFSIKLDASLEAVSLTLIDCQGGKIASSQIEGAYLSFESAPKNLSSFIEAGVKNIWCKDERVFSSKRAELFLLGTERSNSDEPLISCTMNSSKESTSVDIELDQTRFCLIPDAINSILTFFHMKSTPKMTSSERRTPSIKASEQARPSNQSHELSISFKVTQCRILFVDLGNGIVLDGSISESVKPAEELIVFGGGCKGQIKSTYSTHGLAVLEASINGFDLELFTENGWHQCPSVQVIELFDGFAKVKVSDLDKTEHKVDLKAAVLSPLEIFSSIRFIALANAIYTSLHEALVSDGLNTAKSMKNLDAEDARRLEHIDRMLKDYGEVNTDASTVLSEQAAQPVIEPNMVRRTVSVNVSLPAILMTVVNDLQYHDEALLKVTIREIVGSYLLKPDLIQNEEAMTSWKGQLVFSVLADYFDRNEYMWKNFLGEPWEISMKTGRGPPKKATIGPNTALDIEAMMCNVLLSESFLSSLSQAATMWSTYRNTSSTLSKTLQDSNIDLKESVAIAAARLFSKVMPCVLVNDTGFDIQFRVGYEDATNILCESGKSQDFEFPTQKANGSGYKRLYGQESSDEQRIFVTLQNFQFTIVDFEQTVGIECHRHEVDELLLFSQVQQNGSKMSVRLSEGFDIESTLPFPVSVSLHQNGSLELLGRLADHNASPLSIKSGGLQRFRTDLPDATNTSLTMRISCFADKANGHYDGDFDCELIHEHLVVEAFRLMSECQVTCIRTKPNDPSESMVIFGRLFGKRVDDSFILKLCLEPLETIRNVLPLPINIRTKLPYMFCQDSKSEGGCFVHRLSSGESLAVCSSNKSIRFEIGFATETVDGPPYGSTDDIELQSRDNSQPKTTWHPLKSLGIPKRVSQEIFMAYGKESLALSNQSISRDDRHSKQSFTVMENTDHRCLYISSPGIFIDHTNSCLLMCPSKKSSVFPFMGGDKSLKAGDSPFGTYTSTKYEGRVALLPPSREEIQLMRTRVGTEEKKLSQKSEQFKLEDVSICGGGLASSKLCWDDGRSSGLFLYRTLSDFIQTELHVIPELAVFNASEKYEIEVHQTDGQSSLVPPGETRGLEKEGPNVSISISWNPLEGVTTAPVRVDELGLRVVVVRNTDGAAIGSVVVQTAGGSVDSYMIVKIGKLQIGSQAQELFNSGNREEFLPRDTLRVRLQLTALRIALIPAQKGRMLDSNTVLLSNSINAQEYELTTLSSRDQKLCVLRLEQVTMDIQRVWEAKRQMTQFSFLVHNLELTDEMPYSNMPVVIRSKSPSRFFDLKIVCSGPLLRTMIVIESFDVKVANNNGNSEKICVNASEAFLLNLTKVLDQLKFASKAHENSDTITLELDPHDNIYRLKRQKGGEPAKRKQTHRYSSPGSEMLFDIRAMRISPISLLFSFEHSPEVLSLSSQTDGKYQNMLTFLSQRLKVKIDQADLKFSKFERTRSTRGPADKFLGILVTFYIAQLKYQIISVLAASNVKLNKKQLPLAGNEK